MIATPLNQHIFKYFRYQAIFGGTIDTQVDGAPPNDQDYAYQDIQSQLSKTKKRVKTMMITLEAQNKLLKVLARKIDPGSFEEIEDLEELVMPQSMQVDYATPQQAIELDTGTETDQVLGKPSL